MIDFSLRISVWAARAARLSTSGNVMGIRTAVPQWTPIICGWGADQIERKSSAVGAWQGDFSPKADTIECLRFQRAQFVRGQEDSGLTTAAEFIVMSNRVRSRHYPSSTTAHARPSTAFPRSAILCTGSNPGARTRIPVSR
jgi:hypothetical protein